MRATMIADAGARDEAPRWARWPPLGALVALAVWIALFITGGFSFRAFRVDLSAHEPWPALVVAGAFALLSTVAPVRRALPAVCAGWWPGLTRAAARVSLVAAAALLAVAVHWGSFVAGGADSYGYVSQAHLWARGELRTFQPIALMVSWPDSDWTFSPLGYRPGRRSGFIVPTYSPGLPLLMAAALRTVGPTAMFFIVPILATVMVWFTFVIGRRVHSERAGLMAAVLVATSPIVLFQAVQPMSDVPVTAWWMASLAAALRRDVKGGALAGLAASAALMTRPNLVPLVIPVAIYLLLVDLRRDGWRRRALVTLAFGLALIPAIAAIAKINAVLYGSPLNSGYGSLSDIYALENISPNSSRYLHWLTGSHTWFVGLAALAPAVAFWRRRGPRHDPDAPRPADAAPALRIADTLLFLAFAAVLFGCYALYLVFSDWTYLRFLLPAVPLLLVLASAVTLDAIALLPMAARAPAVVLFTTALAAWYLAEARESRTFQFAAADRHYADVGHYAARALPERAVLVAVQESGSLRYYGGRLTLRWDMIPAERFDSVLEELRQKGYPPYLVLETWEEPVFRRQFDGRTPLASLDWPPLADVGLLVRARIYDPFARARYLAGEEIHTDRVIEGAR